MIEEELPVGQADEAFSEDGSLADPELRERYRDIVDQLISEAEQAGAPESVAA